MNKMNDREIYENMTNLDKSEIVAKMMNELPDYVLRNLVVKNFNHSVVEEENSLRQNQVVEVFVKIAGKFLDTTFGCVPYAFSACEDESNVLDRIEKILIGNTVKLCRGYDAD